MHRMPGLLFEVFPGESDAMGLDLAPQGGPADPQAAGRLALIPAALDQNPEDVVSLLFGQAGGGAHLFGCLGGNQVDCFYHLPIVGDNRERFNIPV